MFCIKVCQWLDSNHGRQLSEASTLLTEPQPLIFLLGTSCGSDHWCSIGTAARGSEINLLWRHEAQIQSKHRFEKMILDNFFLTE